MVQLCTVPMCGNSLRCCSAGSGGALWIEDTAASTVTQFSSSTFAGNVAFTAQGGVVALAGGFHNIANSTFLANSAANAGGAITFFAMCRGKNTVFGGSEAQVLSAVSSYSDNSYLS